MVQSLNPWVGASFLKSRSFTQSNPLFIGRSYNLTPISHVRPTVLLCLVTFEQFNSGPH